MEAATIALVRAAGIYIALITLMGVVLTYLVIFQRRSKLIGIGDGGDRTLARLVRVHGNYCENAPFGLAVLLALALTGGPAWLIHAVGAGFLAGRALHAWGLSQSAGSSIGRVAGMILTHTALIVGAGALILAGFAR
jgi:uncharacterized protein